ncbi:bifunctional diaminohydroxyphosphoribosylaminopyrimidine deaminase/5-amino-6-(5-phosphoribosylamino)uracil reductase RibD [Saccharothrix variisporea]|uniref:diaminohydroxyphosphoribosylaminopyrimidine deaminase n=1 Tax=Saccharothrix variisporea TaxID=543527 RepID=A0A495X765_9PSEU|nr:bifunctional diaminohydroxyphosphoribosylaminopyrimidine deaminase/5-amino-6-(5-phosphoribosylamino)uracil reductase RibD [Saccharothrix variisporea]RKT69399.1 diaminohydroxyphosphoribosylaminopyrimidine deaminase [Saccharothrix variisporea]
MTASEIEVSTMRRAIVLSAHGLGRTSPNPPVGCVILDASGQVVGEGYHERKGEPHAEVHALAAAGELSRGGTAVVTLEPCNHYGRTPPCREALINAGVARVVIAVMDPTSREEGGAARLRAAGVEVEVGVLADEARLVLGTWLDVLDRKRPVVTWSYRHTDGQIEPLPPELVVLESSGVDIVVAANGHVSEALPGSHGSDVFTVPSGAPLEEPVRFLEDLYLAGARTVVLATGTDLARPFIHGGLIDRIVVYSESSGPSQHRDPTRQTPMLPLGFVVDEVSSQAGCIRVDARPVNVGSPSGEAGRA